MACIVPATEKSCVCYYDDDYEDDDNDNNDDDDDDDEVFSLTTKVDLFSVKNQHDKNYTVQ